MGLLQLALLTALALVSASAWKNEAEYVYHFRTRTLSGVDDNSNEYSGVVMKGRFHFSPKSDDTYMAKLSDVQAAQIHSHLYDGWESRIPDSQLSYQPWPTNNQPFKIIMKNGVVSDVFVAQNTPEWEVNVIKGIVSQIQLDTLGHNVMESRMNQLPKEGNDFAVFKTMEKTITGNTETLYEIKPYPEYLLEQEPWLAPLPHLGSGGKFLEVAKSRNYSNSEQRPSFNYGFYDDAQNSQKGPSSNTMGQYFIRTGSSRAIISGTLQRYAIQSIESVNKILLQTDLSDKLYGKVVSYSNLTLHSVQPTSSIAGESSSLKSVGSLVYTYKEQNLQQTLNKENSKEQSSEESNSRSLGSEEDLQRKPRLNEPLQTPLLMEDYAAQKETRARVVLTAKQLAKQIGQELSEPEKLEKSHTLDKHILLTNLLRTLDDKELQGLANELYTTEQSGPDAKAWMTFRDAVCEAGTGPAFLTIQFWIRNRKINGREAANVVARMARSAIQPTDEYIKAFFALISQPEVENEEYLNVSAITSFSHLVNHVYMHKRNSHNKYPVHNFGTFATENGKEFVINEYIPYLKQKLQNAIQQADNQRIHAYITAIGMVGHKKILEVFEPYLEGQYKINQFQRSYMVNFLRPLAKADPEVARSVLYKIYQNIGEDEDVRVIAVYNLMLTQPPKSMLQRMAMYTNYDPSLQVSSAVKSIILSAAEARGQRFTNLRVNARAAVPLLTRKPFGQQFSKGYMHTFEHSQLDVLYEQTLNWVGSKDTVIPKAINYAWNTNTGGFMQHLASIKAKVSSFADLYDEIEDLIYDTERESKQSQTSGEKLDAEQIAQVLNMHPRERQELEGLIRYQIYGLTGLYSFNNKTIKNQIQNLKKWEEKLRSGVKLHYSKIVYGNKQIASFPMDMGFLFIYTLNKPVLIQIDGQVTATAQPQLSDGQKIYIPSAANLQADFKFTAARKVQARYGFLTHFDGHYYTAGSDKHVQVYAPLAFNSQVDLKKHQATFEMQMKEPERNTRLFHMDSYTYTSHHDVKQMKPLIEDPNTRIHNNKRQQHSENIYGQKSGMKYKVAESWEDGKEMKLNVFDFFKKHGAERLINRFYDEPMSFRRYSIEYQGSESPNQKVKTTFSLKMSSKMRENQKASGPESITLNDIAQTPRQSQERLNDIYEKVSSGINSPRVYVADANVQFLGRSNSEYAASVAIANSPVDDKARALFYYRRQPVAQSSHEPQQIALIAEGTFPNTNGLNFEYALNFDPTSKIDIHAAAGKDLQSGEKVHVQIELKQSEEMKDYVRREADFYLKRNKAEYGFDNMYPKTWAALTTKSNIMDHVHVNIDYQHLSHNTMNLIQQFYDMVDQYIGEYKNVTYRQKDNEEKVNVHFEFSPDFEEANVTIRTPEKKIEYEEFPIRSWMKPFVASHPVFSLPVRIWGHLLNHKNYRPSCVFDQHYISTFDNSSYPVHLKNDWTVAFFYEPRISSDRPYSSEHQVRLQQLQQELREEHYAIYVRSRGGNQEQREVKVSVRSPENNGKRVEIELTPSGGKPAAKVSVNGQQMNYNENQVTSAENGLIELYALPNGEMKLEVRDAFYIIYDGSKIKVSVTDEKFHGHLRGLCGTYTGQMIDDFTDPQCNIIGNPQEFVADYTLSDDQSQRRQQDSEKDTQRKVMYGNYISHRDTERYDSSSHGPSAGCYRHQTQYIEQPGTNQICFTVRNVPVCQKGCRVSKSLTKSIQAHCVTKSSVTDIWKKQIDMGANPDFSQKSPNQSIKFTIPLKCTPTSF